MIHAEVVRRLVQGAREARALGLRDSADLLLARLRVVAAPAEILPLLMEMAGGGPRADPPQPQNC
jgi:hypothetical protein